MRVLELADQKGQYCGKLMADLGPEVIKIEPPGGEATRTVGPFLDDLPHRDRSLSFWHYNTSKRGITLRSEEHTSELQSQAYLVCRLLLEKKNTHLNSSHKPIT